MTEASQAMQEARRELYKASSMYEDNLVRLFCVAYKDATGVWPKDRLEQALREAVRGNT